MGYVIKSLVNKAVTPPKDQRGTHHNRPNRIQQDSLQSVHDHIESIPKYQSHYSRFSNPNKVYFGAYLNISRLYNDFNLPFCDERGINPVKEDRYRRIFSESYNIGFKFPKSDTCAICDELHIVINNEDTELAAKARAESEKELHLRYADSLRQKMTECTQTAKNNPNDVHVITVDLQQMLPTPGPCLLL